MSKNSLTSELNKKQWESNLVRFEKPKNVRKYTKVVDSLDQMNKMPTEVKEILSWADLSPWL